MRRIFAFSTYGTTRSDFCFRLEFLERLPEGAKNTDVHGDRRYVWKHAHGVAYLLADTLKETRNDLRSLDQTSNLFQEIDHHRLIVLPAGMVRDG